MSALSKPGRKPTSQRVGPEGARTRGGRVIERNQIGIRDVNARATVGRSKRAAHVAGVHPARPAGCFVNQDHVMHANPVPGFTLQHQQHEEFARHVVGQKDTVLAVGCLHAAICNTNNMKSLPDRRMTCLCNNKNTANNLPTCMFALDNIANSTPGDVGVERPTVVLCGRTHAHGARRLARVSVRERFLPNTGARRSGLMEVGPCFCERAFFANFGERG
eukprot:scaffold880_cov139-Ochromonas_danica.AAC.1